MKMLERRGASVMDYSSLGRELLVFTDVYGDGREGLKSEKMPGLDS